MPIFSCPKCEVPLQIPDKAEGMILACPQCEQSLLIPATNAPPPPKGAFQAARTVRFAGPGASADAGADLAPKEDFSLLHFVPSLSEETARFSIPKPFFLGLLGAIGCLMAAMLFEYPLHFLTPAPAEKTPKKVLVVPAQLKVDVVFVLDTTGSMGEEINGVRQNIERFVNGLKLQDMDVLVGLVHFRDRLPDGSGNVPTDHKELLFDGKPFTRDPIAFRRQMEGLSANDGGDAPESSWDALDYASALAFRDDAAKVLILITDAGPRNPDKDNKSAKEVADKLRLRKIQQLHLIVKDDFQSYVDIQNMLNEGRLDERGVPLLGPAGKKYNLSDVGRGVITLERILEGTSREIAEEVRRQSTVRGLTVEGEYESEDVALLVTAVSFWTAGLALGLTLALIIGSKLYLRQSPFGFGTFAKGSLSLFAGLIGGLVAQGLVLLLTWGNAEGTMPLVWDLVAKVLGWTVMGSLVGMALAFFVPNLSLLKGWLGGGLGGFSGALFFIVFTALFGDWLGRWLGALALGFCVGMMVALVETVFRRWWIEIRFGTGETRTVTLGSARVSLGSDPLRATVVLPDGPAIACRFYLANGRVLCEDKHGAFRLRAGETHPIGETIVTVCSPESVSGLGLVLELTSGKTIPLSAGLPLTADDIPGLQTSSPDGTVALISPHAAHASSLWMRNRSKERWQVPTGEGEPQPVEPGQSIPLLPGMSIDFGQVVGRLSRPRVYKRSALKSTAKRGALTEPDVTNPVRSGDA